MPGARPATLPTSAGAGAAATTTCSWRGLLVTPEERTEPVIGRATLSCGPRHRTVLSPLPDIRCLISEQQRRRLHLALLDKSDDRPGDIDPVEAVAAAKIGLARNLEEALSYLRPDEQAIALAMPALFRQLSSLAATETPSLVVNNGKPDVVVLERRASRPKVRNGSTPEVAQARASRGVLLSCGSRMPGETKNRGERPGSCRRVVGYLVTRR